MEQREIIEKYFRMMKIVLTPPHPAPCISELLSSPDLQSVLGPTVHLTLDF